MISPVDSVEDLVPYVPGKPVEELERELGISGASKLGSNENPLGPSPLALKAIKKAINDINRYPDGDCFYLKRKLSSVLNVSPDNLLIGNGSNEVIEIIARTYLSSKDEVIYGENAFIVFPLITQAVGAKAVVSKMPELVHDLDDMTRLISSNTKVIFLANPNNPTGTIFTKDDFDRFIAQVPDHILVVVDEAYFEYVEDDSYPNSLLYHERYKNIVTVRTFSKVYGLAGLRIGYCVAQKEIISFLNRVREPFNVSSIAQVASVAALEDFQHVRRTKEMNRKGLVYLYAKLDELGVSYTPSKTNFVLVDLKTDPTKVYESLLREGVIVRPVGAYGLKKHLRVTVGNEKENKRFINALKKVLKL